jgi:hypothetical protein
MTKALRIARLLLSGGVCVRRAAGQGGVPGGSLGQVIYGQKPTTPALAHAFARRFSYSRQWRPDFRRARGCGWRLEAANPNDQDDAGHWRPGHPVSPP